MIFESKIPRPPSTQTRLQPETQLPLQRKCASRGRKSGFQSGLLAMSRLGNAFEVEADRAAERVMSADQADASLQIPSPVNSVSRDMKSSGDETGLVQHYSSHAGSGATSVVPETLGSQGQPLDRATRDRMEPRFGHDFSRVRIHADERAATAANAVNARAFTVGNHVGFAAGQFAPASASGRELLAHELTHVVQQQSLNSAALQRKSAAARARDPLEEDEEEHARAYRGPTEAPSQEPGEEAEVRLPPSPHPLPNEQGTDSAGKEKESKRHEGDIPESESEEGGVQVSGGVEVEGGYERKDKKQSVAVKEEVGAGYEGKFGGGASSIGGEGEKEKDASGESEKSTFMVFRVEGNLKLGALIRGEKPRFKHLTLLKIGAEGSLAGGSSESRGMERRLQRAAVEGTIEVIGFAFSDIKVRKTLIDVEAALAATGGVEADFTKGFKKKEGPLKREIGGEATLTLTLQRRGGPLSVDIKGTVRVGDTEKGLHVGGGAMVVLRAPVPDVINPEKREERRKKRQERRKKRKER